MEKGSDDWLVFIGEVCLNKYFIGMRVRFSELFYRGTCTSFFFIVGAF